MSKAADGKRHEKTKLLIILVIMEPARMSLLSMSMGPPRDPETPPVGDQFTIGQVQSGLEHGWVGCFGNFKE